MFHARIEKIEVLSDFVLLATFVGGIQKLYDMKPWIERKNAFKPLKNDIELFNSVQTDCGGYGIAWNDDIDLDAHEIWVNGVFSPTTNPRKWDIIPYLQNDESIAAYLDMLISTDDYTALIEALNKVAKVKGFNNLAEKMGVGRESLYKSLSGTTKPRFETIYKMLQALGLKLGIRPINIQ